MLLHREGLEVFPRSRLFPGQLRRFVGSGCLNCPPSALSLAQRCQLPSSSLHLSPTICGGNKAPLSGDQGEEPPAPLKTPEHARRSGGPGLRRSSDRLSQQPFPGRNFTGHFSAVANVSPTQNRSKGRAQWRTLRETEQKVSPVLFGAFRLPSVPGSALLSLLLQSGPGELRRRLQNRAPRKKFNKFVVISERRQNQGIFSSSASR